MPLRPVHLLVAAITAVGAALRLLVLGESPFGDELSTYWIVASNGMGGVVETVHSDAEITPPLYFMLAELATRVEFTPEMLRAPSLVAGVAAIPLVYALATRTVGGRAGIVAAALTALSPFMIYYSAEARGYQLMIVLVLLSTLALLNAVDRGGTRWWVGYAVCSCAAAYTHYTAFFALGAQFLWLLWAHPQSWRPALLANLGAAAGFAPWIPGLLADFDSPTTDLLALLAPFELASIGPTLGHWSLGYPYRLVSLRTLPGDLALAMAVAAVGIAVVSLAIAARDRGLPRRIDRRLALIVVLALSAPLGQSIVSLFSSDIFAVRSMAVSWPAFAIVLATLVAAAPRRLWIACSALAIAAFGIGALKMTETDYQRPDADGVAELIERRAAPDDVVVDGFVLNFTPGPVSPLDAQLDGDYTVLRAGAPQQRDHPFNVFDPVAPPAEVARIAAAGARGSRLFVVTSKHDDGGYDRHVEAVLAALPDRFRRVGQRPYPGLYDLVALVYRDSGPSVTAGS